MSKDINISYEDLVFGAFTALLLTNTDDESLTYEQLNDYEKAITEYCTAQQIKLLLNTNEEAKEKFRQEHDEFMFGDQKIFLANLSKWLQKKNAALDVDEATVFLNGTVVKPLIKGKTLSYR